MDDAAYRHTINQQALIDGLDAETLRKITDLRGRPNALKGFVSVTYHNLVRDQNNMASRKEEMQQMLYSAQVSLKLASQQLLLQHPEGGLANDQAPNMPGLIPDHLFPPGVTICAIANDYPAFNEVLRDHEIRRTFCAHTPPEWFESIGQSVLETRRVKIQQKAVKYAYNDWFCQYMDYVETTMVDKRNNAANGAGNPPVVEAYDMGIEETRQCRSQVQYILESLPEIEIISALD